MSGEVYAGARRLASRVLIELDLAGVMPTPRAFELWHAHLSGAKPDLSRDLAALLKQSPPPSPATLETLYSQHFASDFDQHSVAEGADALRQEAQGLIEDVAANSNELLRYDQALSDCSIQLTHDRSVESLSRALATLTMETARASSRNRVLEQQLAAATARVSRLRDSLAEVKREATTDTLTGLCNRKAFDARLRRALTTAKADGVPMSLLLLDVDHFKRVNDTHGHQVGDLVLRLIGRLLSESVKGRDTAARYGGEEFAIILAGADRRAGVTVGEQIRIALEAKSLAPKASGPGPRSVTVSIGVAQLRPDDSGSALMTRADEALYRAKREGRNRVCADLAIEDEQLAS
ncbi:MAG: GGDEF domain-containing protein [Acetobacteraceae bacterium]